jgi:signal transduction histidine kinase
VTRAPPPGVRPTRPVRPLPVVRLLGRAFAGLIAAIVLLGVAGIGVSLRYRPAALPALVAVTGLTALLAVLTAVRVTGRIARPLGRLLAALDRLGDGVDRAPTDADVAEVAALAHAVNRVAAEAHRARDREAEAARLAEAGHRLGIRIRRHLSVSGALAEAAAGLGPLLDADHVVIRLAGSDRGGARWSRVGPGGTALGSGVTGQVGDPGPGTGVAIDAPAGAGVEAARPGASGTVEPLAGLSPDWLLAGGGERAYVWNDLAAADPPAPPEELVALRAAGAGRVLTVVFADDADPPRAAAPGHHPPGPAAASRPPAGQPAGAVTVIRQPGAEPWSARQVRVAEAVTADLGRGLLHAQLYEREQELAGRLRDLDEAKTDFMATVSHELRTPLTSIAGYLEMLSDGDAGGLTPAQERMLAVIARNTARLRALIEDLLVLSRIDSGTLPASRRDVEFGWLITSAVAAVRPAAAAAGVSIETEVGGGLTGRADPEQLDRVLTNLLGNAVKFTPRGGRVRVCAERDGDEVTVRVSDTGMGIPEDDQRHVFTRFFRARNAAEQAIPGTGLGLAIVRTIVSHHGGRVSVMSREGEGTTVTVRLPC